MYIYVYIGGKLGWSVDYISLGNIYGRGRRVGRGRSVLMGLH